MVSDSAKHMVMSQGEDPILEQDCGVVKHRLAALARGSLSLVLRRSKQRVPVTSQAEVHAISAQFEHGA